MNRTLPLIAFGLFVGSVFTAHAADIDTVHRKSDPKPVGGQITTVSRTEIVVHQTVGNKDISIPANDITDVEWKVEPPSLGLARSNEASGNFDEALAGYQEALGALEAGTANVKADIGFLLARTATKIAQRDAAQLPTALQQLKAYVDDNRDFFRFYEAQLLLGETALAAGDYVAADSAYTIVQQAPWDDFKMAGQLGSARTLLAQDKIAQAQSIFNQVAAVDPKNAAQKSRQLEAKIGQADCMKQQSQFAEATKVLDEVIAQTGAEDSRVLAEAYLRLGDCYAADGQQLKQAVLAYLHIDVIPSLAEHSDLHAEALYNLAKLWPAIGQPARGAEASAKLEQDYVNSEWTKKLGSGS